MPRVHRTERLPSQCVAWPQTRGLKTMNVFTSSFRIFKIGMTCLALRGESIRTNADLRGVPIACLLIHRACLLCITLANRHQDRNSRLRGCFVDMLVGTRVVERENSRPPSGGLGTQAPRFALRIVCTSSFGSLLLWYQVSVQPLPTCSKKNVTLHAMMIPHRARG